MRRVNPVLELASGEFDRRKAEGIQYPGIATVARMFGVPGSALANYRANYVSRHKTPWKVCRRCGARFKDQYRHYCE